MNCYEVFVKLVSHGKEIGKTCIQLQASSPFQAAAQAGEAVDSSYGKGLVSRTLRVSEISEDEFLYQMAA